ncbi:transmembrane protein 25 isoform X4 [Tyto alba]|uniref:transmembrane protein 25 isoform X4 n=1 Tax=Tyto alba TaxID=56313 RepID=UPI001C670F8C|nr:transmembrane protein 25 isoform X4 [Tyto alba]
MGGTGTSIPALAGGGGGGVWGGVWGHPCASAPCSGPAGQQERLRAAPAPLGEGGRSGGARRGAGAQAQSCTAGRAGRGSGRAPGKGQPGRSFQPCCGRGCRRPGTGMAPRHCSRRRPPGAERGRCAQGRPGAWPGAALARLLLLLGLPVLCSAGPGEPGPTINGQPLAVCALREEESRAFTCRAPRPAPGAALLWYLDGRRQEANCSAAGTASTLTLTARRTDRELNCSLTDPASDKPEILRADARYQEVEGAGLVLVLFVLVQANPPASVTWVDQDGRVMANASEVLLLGATRYPGLANHSLRVHLDGAASNFSISAANSVGVTTASLLPPGLLDSRVELPLLGVAVGAALALGALLSLGSCAACLACRRPAPEPGKGRAGESSPLSRCSRCSRSEPPRLPRQTRSLPPDLRLGDLEQAAGGLSFPTASPDEVGASAGGEESALPAIGNSLVLSKFHPAPTVRAHLQSAEREQRRDLAVRRGVVPLREGCPAPGTYRPLEKLRRLGRAGGAEQTPAVR